MLGFAGDMAAGCERTGIVVFLGKNKVTFSVHDPKIGFLRIESV